MKKKKNFFLSLKKIPIFGGLILFNNINLEFKRNVFNENSSYAIISEIKFYFFIFFNFFFF